MDVFDVVAIGNAKVDVFLQVHETNKHFRFDPLTREICVKSGDKALVDRAYFMIGGNAANVSVGASKLGFKSAIIAEVGDDEFSSKIINTLKREGVSEVHLKQTQGDSSVSVILNFNGERTIFEEEVERDNDFSFDEISTKWIYLTSLGEKWRGAYKKTLEFIISNNVKLAFNPGTFQIDAGKEGMDDILKNTDLLFVNKEEAQKILNQKSRSVEHEETEEIEYLLRGLQSKGSKIVVITDGIKGSWSIDEKGNFFSCDPINTSVVEKTGAGDSYATGFLGAVLSGLDLKTAMLWGNQNAGSVIGMVGAEAGLLTREEMEKRVKNE